MVLFKGEARAIIFGAVVLGICGLQPVFAGPPPTVTFNLTGVNSAATLAGVYTSPYYGNVNSGATIPVICDDFNDNSYVPEEWTTYVTSLSSVPTSGNDTYLKWSVANSDGGFTAGGANFAGWNIANQQEAYTIGAYLELEILNAVPASQNQEDLSFALWELFDAQGDGARNWGGTGDDQVVSWLSGDQTDLNNASNDVVAAINAYNTNNNLMAGFNVTIYSYDSGGMTPQCGGSTCSTLPPQEFMTVTAVPEASSICEFAFYLLLGGGGFLFFNRRRAHASRR